jgi:S-adenosylmethionine synthetase
MTYLFTSESVSEGHPDKICDQISDAILDEALRQDPTSRVAVECFTTTGMVLIGGEISSQASIDYQTIARKTLAEIGYTRSDFGIDAESCNILTTVHTQSPDIAQGVNKGEGLYTAQGAGDQGLMFGYACSQTDTFMPLPIYLSHKVAKRLSDLRKNKILTYLRPDAKVQFTIEYEGNSPKRIETIVISTQHSPDISHEKIERDMIEEVIKPLVPTQYLDHKTRYLINPTGRFVIGGPHGDAGLTGRKIIVDTYGGWARHGGGAFSGKDPSKVDRSAAYMARYIAKNLVAAGVSEELELQIAYAIGVAEPVSIHLNTNGTAKLNESLIKTLILNHFELTPEGIISTLKLKNPIYFKTASYGHFGRDDISLSWESLDKVEALKKAISDHSLIKT